MLNALTIDLEEWFCSSNFEDVIHREQWSQMESRVEIPTQQLLNILKQHDVKATFFVLGWVAERHPKLIKNIADAGHEIACHGYFHQLVYNLSPQAFKTDLKKSLEIIKDITGVTCQGYRAPSFSLRRDMTWAWKILTDFNITYDSSIFPVVHDRYGDPDAPCYPFIIHSDNADIIEFPMSTIRIANKNLPVAGGGYFRLYPIAITQWAIKRINTEGKSATVYLHPWEIDPSQPKPNVSLLNLTRHRIGMNSVLYKLDVILKQFKFGSIQQLINTDLNLNMITLKV